MTRAQPTPEWMTQAACLDYDPEIWFPVERHDTGTAVAICSTCPVRQECLAYAIELDVDGVWGGLTRKQRGRRYPCQRCGASTGSYRRTYCPPCAAEARVESNARTSRERRAAS